MYFPTLDIMKHYQIDEILIKKLDLWLGTRRKATKKYLSPLQFSIDCDIDEETSMGLFVLCIENAVHLLKQRYTIECRCGRIIGDYESVIEIPMSYHCIECNREYETTMDMIVIWFELLVDSQAQPLNLLAQELLTSGGTMGNGYSLRLDKVNQSSNDSVRRLLNGLNERIRSNSK